MSLTTSELARLRGVLADEPGDDAFLELAEDLLRRGTVDALDEAVGVLERALDERNESARGWMLLARCRLRQEKPAEAMAALRRLPMEGAREREASWLWMEVLEAAGRVEALQARIRSHLFDHGPDEVVEAIHARVSPPDPGLRTGDPGVTVERAEAFAAGGFLRRAVRLYRRLVFHHPAEGALKTRLAALERELGGVEARDAAPPSLTGFVMPAAGLGASVTVDEVGGPGDARLVAGALGRYLAAERADRTQEEE